MFKPMLAGKVGDCDNLEYPLLASPKLDGIRCIIFNGTPVSRNMKPIPNKAIQQVLGGLPSMDGELVIGPPTAKDCFNRTSSGVMSVEGVPEFVFYVFDVVLNAGLPFNQRYEMAVSWAGSCGRWVQPVQHKLIKTADGLANYEEQAVAQGYEGIMVRSLDGPYKHGRATEREGYLLKLKRFSDSEAEVLGTVEKMHNDNELTQDELGRAKRSSHKAGKRPAGVMGALTVRDVYSGVQFEIGAGFTDAQRAEPWLAGSIVKYKFQPAGVKDKPRFPVFIGRRHADDI